MLYGDGLISWNERTASDNSYYQSKQDSGTLLAAEHSLVEATVVHGFPLMPVSIAIARVYLYLRFL